jgi:hypothetical protein
MTAPEFSIDVDWPCAAPDTGVPDLDATVGCLRLRIDDLDLTTHQADGANEGVGVTLPAVLVAQWLAENWWPLLWEPAKGDDSFEDPGFVARHWLGSARRGFALPDIWFLPSDALVELAARPAYLPFAAMQFTAACRTRTDKAAFQRACWSFLEGVRARLQALGATAELFDQAFERLRTTEPEAEAYCRHVGALGLDPYIEHSEVDALLDRIVAEFAPSIVWDICKAARPDTLAATVGAAQAAQERLEAADRSTLAPLTRTAVPPDRPEYPAWRFGLESANAVREAVGIDPGDPSGGDRFFQALDVGLEQKDGPADADAPTYAMVQRRETEFRIGLLHRRERSRRFHAARAAFLAWQGQPFDCRLVTPAVERDQQAGRAFAAELLAPIRYIRQRAGQHALSYYLVEDIAEDLKVDSAVVAYQARNNGLSVSAAL